MGNLQDDVQRFFGNLKTEKYRSSLQRDLFDKTFRPLAHCWGKACLDRDCHHERRLPVFRKIAAFDTENWQESGSGHKKGEFRYGCVWKDHQFFDFECPRDMGRFLLGRRFAGFYVWAHNLAYDLQNIWGDRLPQEGCIIGSQLYFADYAVRTDSQGNGREYIHFRDSTRHYPARLSTLGDKLGMPKLFADSNDLDSLGHNEIKARCRQDTLIVAKFIGQLQETYNEFGTSLRATVGSSSLELFRRRYMGHNHTQLNSEILELQTRAYYGGRCEAFYIGELPPGQYAMGDVNSMYPGVMRDLQLPIPSLEYCKHVENKNKLEREGSSEVSVRVPRSEYPCLPYRRPDDGKLIFPYGRFRGWWTHNELRYALQQGVKILKFHQSIYFTATCVPFRNFVNDLYELKLQGGWKALVAKHLLNNNYGKWAQSRPPTQLIPGADYIEAQIRNRSGSQIVTEHRNRDGELLAVLVKPEGYAFPLHSNVIWGAYITAEARIRLHQLLVQHRALYCDTDSILTTDPLGETSELGALSLQTSATGAYLAGPKAYALYGGKRKLKVKGVPNRPGWVRDETGQLMDTTDIQAMALMGYEIYFDSPLKLVEGFKKRSVPIMRRDEKGMPYLDGEEMDARPNIWYTHSRKLAFSCEKRKLDGKSGWTHPLRVG